MKEVLQAAHDMLKNSRMSAEQVVEAAFGTDENGKARKSHWTLYKEMNPEDAGAKLGVADLCRLMAVTGDISPLEVMARKLGYVLRKVDGIEPDQPHWQGEHAQDTAHLGRMSELMARGESPSVVQTHATRMCDDIEQTAIRYARDYDTGKITKQARQ